MDKAQRQKRIADALEIHQEEQQALIERQEDLVGTFNEAGSLLMDEHRDPGTFDPQDVTDAEEEQAKLGPMLKEIAAERTASDTKLGDLIESVTQEYNEQWAREHKQ